MNIKKHNSHKLVLQVIFCLALLMLPFNSQQPAAAKNLVAQTGQASEVGLQPLASVLNPNGTLKLDGSFSGSFDPQGWAMEIASDGQPRFVNESNAPAGGGENWDSQFATGVSGNGILEEGGVLAVLVKGSDVYIGGIFKQAGSINASSIARWNADARQWYPLGSGITGKVLALGTYGDDIYVGGSFTLAGGQNTQAIARWNTKSQTWSSVGGDFGGHGSFPPYVMAMLVDGDGNIYAGGNFATAGNEPNANNLVVWNASNSAWHSLAQSMGGTEKSNSYVLSLAFHNNLLYAGGRFSQVGSIVANNIAAWDGNAWLPLGTAASNGANDAVYASVSYNGYLYVGGAFTEVYDNTGGGSPTPANHIAMWDGTYWYQMPCQDSGNGVNGNVYALSTDSEGVYVGGNFATLGNFTTVVNNLVHWNPTENIQPPQGVWEGLGGDAPTDDVHGTDDVVFVISGNGDERYVGGHFDNAGGKHLNHVARLTSAGRWVALGNGVNDPVLTIATFEGQIYLGGTFTSAGGQPMGQVARWNPASGEWANLGGGVSGGRGYYAYPKVSAIVIDSGYVYVGGNFTQAGSVPANGIARWNLQTQAWEALGDGVNCTGTFCVAEVHAIAVASGKVFVGGNFGSAGGVTANYIAQWDIQTSTWSAMKNGLTGDNMDVKALAVDKAHNMLYVGGSGDFYDGITTYTDFVAWDITNQKWDRLDGGVGGGLPTNMVNAIVIGGDKLYVGGSFAWAGNGGMAHTNLAVLDINTHTWLHSGSYYHSGISNPVHAIAPTDEGLYIGGEFTQVSVDLSGGENIDANRVARWSFDDNTWQPVESGTDANVMTMATDGNYLYVGGYFDTTGGKAAPYFGRWARWQLQETTVTLSANPPGPYMDGQNIVFTAVVAPTEGTSKPTGNVTFSLDTHPEQTITLDANGVATWTTAGLEAGPYTFTARYNGDTHHAASVSEPISLVAQAVYRICLPLALR